MKIIEKNGENMIGSQIYEASCHRSGCPQCDDCRRDCNNCWDSSGDCSNCWDQCDKCPPNR